MPDAMAEAAELMREGDLLSAHARCFGYFNPTASWPGMLADFLVAARNPQLAVVSHATAAVKMERRLIAWLAGRLGLPDGAGGHFTSGGSEANGAGLQAALTRAIPGFADEGLAAAPGRPLVYASADSHLAWIKLARGAGMGASAVRLVETDGGGRISPEALARTIAADRKAGGLPVMIAATAGTTNAGLIDPLHACADIAARENLHFHVDAAWAGALMLDETRRGLLDGIERADSVTADAHKWLAVPMGAGMIFLRDPGLMARAFAVSTGYMPDGDGADPYVTTNQWSRRFIGAKLWATLRSVGQAGYQALFDQHFELAARLRASLPERGWRLHGEGVLPILLFDDPEGRDSQAIADWIEADGSCWVGRVDFEGASVIRVCFTSYLTEWSDVEILLDRLDAARAALQPR